MKNYIVQVRLNIHGYEKFEIVGVQANTEDEAGTIALAGECHNEPEWDDDFQSCWDDTMMYSVRSVDEVEEQKYKILCEYIGSLCSSYGEDILQSIKDKAEEDEDDE